MVSPPFCFKQCFKLAKDYRRKTTETARPRAEQRSNTRCDLFTEQHRLKGKSGAKITWSSVLCDTCGKPLILTSSQLFLLLYRKFKMQSINVGFFVFALVSSGLVKKSNAICCKGLGQGTFNRECPLFESHCGGGICISPFDCCGVSACNPFCCDCKDGCRGSSGK